MADEREGAEGPDKSPATREKIQSAGRAANAAQPLNAAKDRGGPERYPKVDQSDAVQGEQRSFHPAATPPQEEAGDDEADADARTDHRLGPGGDPAEGKP